MIAETELAHRLGIKQISPVKDDRRGHFALYHSKIDIGEFAPFRRDDQRFGAIEIPRREYHARLAAALRGKAHFGLALPLESGGDPLSALQSSTPTS